MGGGHSSSLTVENINEPRYRYWLFSFSLSLSLLYVKLSFSYPLLFVSLISYYEPTSITINGNQDSGFVSLFFSLSFYSFGSFIHRLVLTIFLLFQRPSSRIAPLVCACFLSPSHVFANFSLSFVYVGTRTAAPAAQAPAPHRS